MFFLARGNTWLEKPRNVAVEKLIVRFFCLATGSITEITEVKSAVFIGKSRQEIWITARLNVARLVVLQVFGWLWIPNGDEAS